MDTIATPSEFSVADQELVELCSIDNDVLGPLRSRDPRTARLIAHDRQYLNTIPGPKKRADGSSKEAAMKHDYVVVLKGLFNLRSNPRNDVQWVKIT